MKIPKAEHAIIAPEKLRDYLLNIAHRRGASKARLLVSMGYSPEASERLEADLREQHLTTDYESEDTNDYGVQYAIVAPLTGPSGRTVTIRSIWQIDLGTDVPRLITLYPGGTR